MVAGGGAPATETLDLSSRAGAEAFIAQVRSRAASVGDGPTLVEPPRTQELEGAAGALEYVLRMRALGWFAAPLSSLLAAAGASYLLVDSEAGRQLPGQVVPGLPDPTGPASAGAEPVVRIDSAGRATGALSIAPYCLPFDQVLFLARDEGGDTVLAVAPPGGDDLERASDVTRVRLADVEATVLKQGPAALETWRQTTTLERLGLVGLAAGVVERSRQLAIDALCAGTRAGNVLAAEQGAQFLAADNDIEWFATEVLAQDAAERAQRGGLGVEPLASARYATAAAAERCVGRALHLIELFDPERLAVALRLQERARHLTVYRMAREHEIREAAAALTA